MVMGANIGTSITNTLVSLTQVSDTTSGGGGVSGVLVYRGGDLKEVTHLRHFFPKYCQ